MEKIDTQLAEVTHTAPDLVEVRFKEGIKLNVQGIREILHVRRQLAFDGGHKVLIVLPDDVDFEMNMMTTDHYDGTQVKDHTIAVAWVAGPGLTHRVTSLYLAYYPSPFPTMVFEREADARAWLRDPKITSGDN